MKNKSIYYSSDQLFSRQSQINFVMGERGNGKTFEGKKKMIKNFLNNGKQSIYIRRRQTDIDEVKEFFFEDIKEHFPDTDFKIDGKYGLINGEKAIIFFALSTSLKKKSSPFPNVTLLVFDEYIEPSFKFPNYLKNDMFYLLELINTVVRKRNDWKLLLIGNTISFVNPFFTMYGIEIKNTEQRFHKFLKDEDDGSYLITIELTDTPDFQEEYSKTKFAKLIKNTSYGSYAMSGKGYEDDNSFILPTRKGQHIFICSLVYEQIEVGLWFNESANIYCDDKIDSSSKRRYAVLNEDMRSHLTHIKNEENKWRTREIKKAYQNGEMYFKNQEIKKFMQKVIKYI